MLVININYCSAYFLLITHLSRPYNNHAFCVVNNVVNLTQWLKKITPLQTYVGELELYWLSQYRVWLQTGRPEFDPRQSQRIFPLASVQTSTEANPASCPMYTGGSSVGVKSGQGVTLTSHSHLVPKSRMRSSYISSPPWRLHDDIFLLLQTYCCKAICITQSEITF
jgi:hypothetical protein